MKRGAILTFWLAVAVPAAFFLGLALLPGAALYHRVFSPAALDWLGAVPKLVFPALAVYWAADVARRFEPGNPSRIAWQLWACGLLGLFLGQAILTVYFVFTGSTTVFPSIADLFFVAGSLAVVAALFAFLRAYDRSELPTGGPVERWGLVTLATLVAAVIVIPVLRPVVAAPAPQLEKFLNLAYPALDFLMLIPALLLLRVSLRFWGGRVWPIWFSLVLGILCTAAGDVLFAYVSGLGKLELKGLLNVAYIVGYGCLAGGVLHQRRLLSE